VTGNVSMPAGTTFEAELSPTAADQLIVGGSATLGGNLQLLAEPGTYTSGTDFRLISAGSVIGTFANVSGQVAGFTNTLQYSATGVDLILSTPPAPASSGGSSTPATGGGTPATGGGSAPSASGTTTPEGPTGTTQSTTMDNGTTPNTTTTTTTTEATTSTSTDQSLPATGSPVSSVIAVSLAAMAIGAWLSRPQTRA